MQNFSELRKEFINNYNQLEDVSDFEHMRGELDDPEFLHFYNLSDIEDFTNEIIIKLKEEKKDVTPYFYEENEEHRLCLNEIV